MICQEAGTFLKHYDNLLRFLDESIQSFIFLFQQAECFFKMVISPSFSFRSFLSSFTSSGVNPLGLVLMELWIHFKIVE